MMDAVKEICDMNRYDADADGLTDLAGHCQTHQLAFFEINLTLMQQEPLVGRSVQRAPTSSKQARLHSVSENRTPVTFSNTVTPTNLVQYQQ